MGYPILVFAPQGTPLTPKAFEVASAAQAKYGVILATQTPASPAFRVPVKSGEYIKGRAVTARGLEDEDGFVLDDMNSLPPGLIRDYTKEVEVGQVIALEFE